MSDEADHPPPPTVNQSSVAPSPPCEPVIETGCCYVIFAFDVGLSIDLDRAEHTIQEEKHRASIRRRRRSPRHFEFHPAPLRVTVSADPVPIEGWRTDANVELVLYDFGAVSLTYRIHIAGPVSDLTPLAEALYENEALLEDARRCVERFVGTIEPAVTKPVVVEMVEDYVLYHVASTKPEGPPRRWLTAFAQSIGQVLRADPSPLTAESIDDVLACRVSFASDDLAIIDWNGAFLFDREAEEVLAVLEYVNVELLEMRYVDDRLDDALDRSYSMFTQKSWNPLWSVSGRTADMKLVAELQLDSALMFEGVNNALKLLGDQYLARVYQLAVQRLHLDDWDANILRKLGVLESIYQKLSDRATSRRMEFLEWIIILLITLSIVISLAGVGH